MVANFLSLKIIKNPNLPTMEKSTKRQDPQPSNFHLQDPFTEESNEPEDKNPKKSSEKNDNQKRVCQACGDKRHLIYKCAEYIKLDVKERYKLIKSKHCCFNCLSLLHQQKNCSSKYICLVDGCKGKHHTSLHYELSGNSKTNPSSEALKQDSKPNGQVNIISTTNKGRVFLQVVPIKVTSLSGKKIKTYALLDGESQCTILRKDFCQLLKLPGDLKHIDLGTLKCSGNPLESKIVNIEVSSLDHKFSINIPNVFSIGKEYFNVPSQSLPVD